MTILDPHSVELAASIADAIEWSYLVLVEFQIAQFIGCTSEFALFDEDNIELCNI